MNRSMAHVLLIGGVVSMVLGISATNSFSSDISRFITGLPADKAVWMFVGGTLSTAFGLGLTWLSRKQA